LIRSLQGTLGTEAADDLVTWMDAMETSRSELREFNELNFSRFDSRVGEQRHWMEAQFALSGRAFDARVNEHREWAVLEFAAGFALIRSEMQTEFAAVRTEMQTEFAAVRTEMQTEFAAVRSEMQTEFAAVRSEMQAGLADVRQSIGQLETRIEQRFADLLRWSFVFWVGTAISLAVLMR
jgi:hypothetical protein